MYVFSGCTRKKILNGIYLVNVLGSTRLPSSKYIASMYCIQRVQLYFQIFKNNTSFLKVIIKPKCDDCFSLFHTFWLNRFWFNASILLKLYYPIYYKQSSSKFKQLQTLAGPTNTSDNSEGPKLILAKPKSSKKDS